MREAVDGLREVLGETHPSTMKVKANFAAALDEKG